MKQLLALLAAFALVHDPGHAQCTVPDQPLPFASVCVMPPLASPVARIQVITAVHAQAVARFENRSALALGAEFRNIRVRVRGALDPSFAFPVLDVLVNVRPIVVAAGPFDGGVDFTGPSGRIQFAAGTGFQIGQIDAPPIRAGRPWSLYIVAGVAGEVDTHGAATAMLDAVAGLSVDVVQVAP